MTGLVLDEYEGVSEDELGPILKEEARKMFGPGWLDNERPSDLAYTDS